jgi:hypothetical protein
LTARVAVNRFWQMLFGRGLVATAEDFGSQGEWPTHPELLDWLAVDFVESGWDVKHLLETIVTSAAYRQSSAVTPRAAGARPRKPPDGPRARASVRRPPRSATRRWRCRACWSARSAALPSSPINRKGCGKRFQAARISPATAPALYRRSLYTYWKRTVGPPAMIAFDASDRESCSVKPKRTNTPLQALNLMNDTIYLEASRHLAERMLREGGLSAEHRLAWGFRLAVARPPSPTELRALAGLHGSLAGGLSRRRRRVRLPHFAPKAKRVIYLFSPAARRRLICSTTSPAWRKLRARSCPTRSAAASG